MCVCWCVCVSATLTPFSDVCTCNLPSPHVQHINIHNLASTHSRFLVCSLTLFSSPWLIIQWIDYYWLYKLFEADTTWTGIMSVSLSEIRIFASETWKEWKIFPVIKSWNQIYCWVCISLSTLETTNKKIIQSSLPRLFHILKQIFHQMELRSCRRTADVPTFHDSELFCSFSLA